MAYLMRYIKIKWLFAMSLALSAPIVRGGMISGTDATGELTGSRSEGLGLVTVGDYAADALTQSIAWNIVSLGGGQWNYEYTFSNFDSPGIGHFILGLSDDCVSAPDPACVTGLVGSFGTFGPSGSNPAFPSGASITGVKFGTANSFSFVSDRAPAYGDFYTKGGSPDHNLGVGYNFGLVDPASQNLLDFIARPDGHGIQADPILNPEPSTYLMMGSGLVLVGMLRRRLTSRVKS